MLHLFLKSSVNLKKVCVYMYIFILVVLFFSTKTLSKVLLKKEYGKEILR